MAMKTTSSLCPFKNKTFTTNESIKFGAIRNLQNRSLNKSAVLFNRNEYKGFCSRVIINVMHTLEKDYKDEHLPIRLMPQEVSEEQTKKSWDAISKAITEGQASCKWAGTMRWGVDVIDGQKEIFKTDRHIPHNTNV